MRLSKLHESSKFRFVILHEELTILIPVDEGMETGYRDISYSYVSVMTSSYSNEVPVFHTDHVNDSDILQSYTFHNYEVRFWPLVL